MCIRDSLSVNQWEDARQIMRDIESLDGHTSFLFGKINFLMDVIVGFININQNKIIKRLTVLSVIFMPLNVIAGMGGMSEFSMMTQGISWPLAYGAFTVGMVGVAYITYLLSVSYTHLGRASDCQLAETLPMLKCCTRKEAAP